jgi:hypothetical protein
VTRRIIWISLLVVGLCVLVGAWFVSNYDRVPVKERKDEEPEARRNPHLALERFLERMGRHLTREKDARVLDALPPGGVLILDRNRRHHMSAARTEHLMAWVAAGGYLIVVPEDTNVSDPVCEQLDVSPFVPNNKNFMNLGNDEDDEESPDEPSPEAKAPPAKRSPKTIAVEIPGASRPLTVKFWPYGLAYEGEEDPQWQAGDDDYGAQFLHFSIGSGQVTVADGLTQILSNRNIGDHDHAELLWTLIQTYQPDTSRPVILMSRLVVPSLWDWLAESAWTALIAGLVLLALWIWRILPRFGPAVPEPDASRRELREHLAALGRYVWRAGGLDHWLRVAREDFFGRLALRHPAVAALPPAEQATELARMSERSASLIAAALHGPAGSPHSFTQAMRTLRNLERFL